MLAPVTMTTRRDMSASYGGNEGLGCSPTARNVPIAGLEHAFHTSVRGAASAPTTRDEIICSAIVKLQHGEDKWPGTHVSAPHGRTAQKGGDVRSPEVKSHFIYTRVHENSKFKIQNSNFQTSTCRPSYTGYVYV